MLVLQCKETPTILQVFKEDCLAYEDVEGVCNMKTLEFIGQALHAIQQGLDCELLIGGRKIEALTLDQTDGSAARLDDIYKVAGAGSKYHRLYYIINSAT